MTRYAAALSALVDPAPKLLMREPAATRAQLADLAAQHLGHVRYLRGRLRLAGARNDAVAAERAVCAMTAAGERYRARRAALTASETSPPSLIEQLVDAVHSTSGAGNGSRGVHRSPLNAAAVELIAVVRRAVGAGRDDDLAAALRAWQPEDDLAAAAQLETWAAAISALFDPPRNLEGTSPCPACGERWVRVREDDEWHRQAAIRIVIHPTGNPADDYAECLAAKCRARWERARWNLLAAAMTTAEKAG